MACKSVNGSPNIAQPAVETQSSPAVTVNKAAFTKAMSRHIERAVRPEQRIVMKLVIGLRCVSRNVWLQGCPCQVEFDWRKHSMGMYRNQGVSPWAYGPYSVPLQRELMHIHLHRSGKSARIVEILVENNQLPVVRDVQFFGTPGNPKRAAGRTVRDGVVEELRTNWDCSSDPGFNIKHDAESSLVRYRCQYTHKPIASVSARAQWRNLAHGARMGV